MTATDVLWLVALLSAVFGVVGLALIGGAMVEPSHRVDVDLRVRLRNVRMVRRPYDWAQDSEDDQ